MWIYEQQDWPNFVWDATSLSTKLTNIYHTRGHLLGRMSNIGFELRLEAQLNTLTEETVKSFAIEGQHLERSEVRSSIAKRLGIEIKQAEFSNREVDGAAEILLDATQNHSASLTKKRLLSWHSALFPTKRSGIHKLAVGKWRRKSMEPMQVVSGPVGKTKVHFEAPGADRLESEMLAFLNWFNGTDQVDPIIKAGIAHFWFVTIHPFEDGNGRLARVIGDMALARADKSEQRFYSLSAQIERERKKYYRALETQQRTSLDITEWLGWFLQCLDNAIKFSDITLDKVLFKAWLWQQVTPKSMNERQRKIINLMLEDDFKGFINTSKYAKLAKCSNDTALRDIQDLKVQGVFIQNQSGGRSTSYRLINQQD